MEIRERSWFPPKSHSKHSFVPSGLFCYLCSRFFPPCSTDETEFILTTPICKAQISSISQAEVAVSIQMGCFKIRQVWTLTSVTFSTEILPCSGFNYWSVPGERYKQHLSNRSRSVKKPKCCSLPSCPQASLATCCSKGTFFNTALDCITAVCKTPCTNKEMGVAATLHPSGRVMERQCLLSTHGHRVLHWKSRARSPACCKYPVYLFSEGTVLLIFLLL